MGFLELTDVAYRLPGGWTLFEGVSFRVPDGSHTALVGANGIGKTTLMRLIAGEEEPAAGSIRVDGRVGLMRQFIGSAERPTTVRAFLLAYSEPEVRVAAARLRRAEERLAADPDERAQLAYADALAAWETAGGYRAEVLWDRCAHEAFGGGFPESADRPIETLSGGERKRLALEIVFRSSFDVVLLDEPDNTLDIEGKEWLEARIIQDPRTILFISHDRTVLERAATHIVTLEGRATWTHAGGLRHVRGRPRRARRPARRAAPPLRGGAQTARGHDQGDEAEGRLQRRLGVEGARGGASARAVRGSRAAAREGRGAACPYARRRRPHRQGRVPGARARHRGHHRSVRRRGALRRADRRDRSERHRQVALPAAARRRGDRARRRVDARRAGRPRLVRAAPRAARHRRSPDPRGLAEARGRAVAGALDAAALRAGSRGRQPVRAAVGRAAGSIPDPADGARLADDAAAGRADRQPRRRLR